LIPQKGLSFKTFAEGISKCLRMQRNAVKNLTQINAQKTDHPHAIYRYKKFISFCKSMAKTSQDPKKQLQVITACKEFFAANKYNPATPSICNNSICEFLIYYVNCIPTNERMRFIAEFEQKYLKGNIEQQYLLFDANFPKLNEKPIGPAMPQLISHVTQQYVFINRSFFSFSTPDSLPPSGPRPIVLQIEDIIPIDMYSKALSQYLNNNEKTTLTIGSFSNALLSKPDAICEIIKRCINTGSIIIVVIDDLLHSHVIHALIHYSHILHFTNYFVIANDGLCNSIPIIPNAIYTKVSRPTNMNGYSRLLRLTPYYHRLSLKQEKPLLYMLLTLSHRRDFPFRLQHILPMIKYTRDYWIDNLGDSDQQRELWKNIYASLIGTMTSKVYIKKSYTNFLEIFFRDPYPRMPLVKNVDYESDIIYEYEIPPSPQECGMLINYGEEFSDDLDPIGWKSIIGKNFIALGTIEKASRVIDAVIINAKCLGGEIGPIGSSSLKLSIVTKNQLPNIVSPFAFIDVYDGREIVGDVCVHINYSEEQFSHSSVLIQLPRNIQ
jgi:hypothetical protein